MMLRIRNRWIRFVKLETLGSPFSIESIFSPFRFNDVKIVLSRFVDRGTLTVFLENLVFGDHLAGREIPIQVCVADEVTHEFKIRLILKTNIHIPNFSLKPTDSYFDSDLGCLCVGDLISSLQRTWVFRKSYWDPLLAFKSGPQKIL